ncbi:restriction endonuclease subunit S [Zhouia amylolytica]|uniref:Type I restriction modification DNA specificity domain-containing protein n=1 Tax=Zhouia amylolytica AD3 TaxID=1286632 RepID=W2UJ84_9FLAO|nr:restriction endonuclease subunit S [Zhouia amylolytica]ETN94009.1 hypothetical protein P278_28130 [Zhouia amylolytica AD3]
MEKRLIPQLRFPEFTSSWEKKYIKSIAKVVGGGTPSTTNDEYWNGEINWFTPTEIKFNVVSESNRKITELGLNNSSATILPKGTILLTTRATIGEVAIAQEECTTNQGFQSLIVNKSNSNQFVFDLIKVYRNELYKRANGSTFKEISKKEIEKIKVLIPQLPEQQKIASFLTDVDAKITQLTKKKELLEQYKKGIMQKIFSQELRFKDDNGNEFPKWEVKKLGDICKIKSSKRVIQEDWKDKGVPFYRTREIISLSENKEFRTPIFITEKMYDELIKKYGVPKENDILVTGVGTIGKTYKVRKDDRFYFKDGNVLWIKINNKINSEFLHQQFNTRFIRKQLSDNASITTVATFTIDGARNTIIKIPSIEEQTKIANFLSDIDIKIEVLNTKIENSKAFKKGLLQQMFV